MENKKLKIKNQKGITLISLVITIVVLLIIIGISIYTGLGNAKETRENTRKTELHLVQQAVIQKYTKYNLTKDEDILKGNAYTDFTELNALIEDIKNKIGVTINLKDGIASNYYLLDESSLADLGITNTEDEYIVNYKTGEVLNKTKLVNKKSKEPLYIYIKTSN